MTVYEQPMQEELNNDAALLELLRQGDAEAYVELYDRYHAGLHAWLLSFVKIPAIAQDIVQEVFMKIWEIRGRLQPHQSFPAFIYRIARNRAINMLGKISTDHKLRKQLMFRLQESAENPEQQLLWQQYQLLLGMAIRELPRQRQKIYTLCRQEGKTYDEAAMELGISRNTVKEHMVMAMKDIKEYFYRHGDLSLTLLLLLHII